MTSSHDHLAARVSVAAAALAVLVAPAATAATTERVPARSLAPATAAETSRSSATAESTVALFALDRDRIAFVSNRDNAHNNHRSVWSRPVALRRGHVRFGPTTRVSPLRDKPQIQSTMAIAAAVTAYATTEHGAGKYAKESLNIVTRHGARKIHRGAGQLSYISASRRWVTVSRARGAGVVVVNLRTGQVRRILRGYRYGRFAVSGNFFNYADRRGRIVRMDLRSGKHTVVYRTGVHRSYPPDSTVVARGPWVGWAVPKHDGHLASGMRDVRSDARVVHFRHQVSRRSELYAMSPHGALLYQHTDSGTTILIHGFHQRSQVRALDVPHHFQRFYADYPVSYPQISRELMAWIDPNGQLKVAPYHSR